MLDFHLLARHTVRTTLWVTLLAVILWAIVPTPWRQELAGFAIGSAVSSFYALSAARQIETARRLALGLSNRRPGIAGISRLAVVALGGFVVSRFHESIAMFLIGMFVSQIVIYATLLITKRKG